MIVIIVCYCFFFKQKTAYELRISDWSSDVCSSDLALMGAIPAGYYKDPVKSAKTFRTIDGVRYSIPGDWCMVEADGSLTLLGRGSVCINTAGEKVYPEEVEEILKTHPDRKSTRMNSSH